MERKFKVWDKENNKWIDDSDIAINQEGLLFIRYEGQCEFQPMSLTKSANYEIVFFTGHLDKSKKKIFNGDIIEVTKKIDGNKVVGEVFWNKKKVGFDFTFDYKKFNLIILGDLVRKFPLGTLWDNVRVIGNKFENGELLR